MLNEHLSLGPKKCASYLPIDTVEIILNLSINCYERLVSEAKHDHTTILAPSCCINPGAIYAFNIFHLEKIIEENMQLLYENDWPISSSAFIRKIAMEWLTDDDPILPVIKRAFGDLV